MLRLARNQQITIFTSEPLLLELETTLKRSKFQPQLQQRDYTVEYLMSVVKGFSTWEHLSYAMSRNTQRASMREYDKR